MITHIPLITSNLPIRTLVARQWPIMLECLIPKPWQFETSFKPSPKCGLQIDLESDL